MGSVRKRLERLEQLNPGEEPGEEDKPISRRVQELYEEVRNGH